MASANPNFLLTPASPSDYYRLGEIQFDAFGTTDAVAMAVFRDVTKEDYIDWVVRTKEAYVPEPGSRKEVVTARDTDGSIVGWAQWSMPTSENNAQSHNEGEGVEKASEAGNKVKVTIPNPKGMREDVLDELFTASRAYEKKYLGDRPHWCTSPLSRLYLAQD
jgi:hypothetical protein